MAVHEWLKMKQHNLYRNKIFNFCQDGENASMGFGITLNSDDIPVE
jgi:hypothetical protein